MAKTLTASDRTALIRLASSLPAGSHERRAILAGLSKSAFGGTKMAGRDPHEEARAMIDDWKKGLRPLFSSKNFEWTDKYLEELQQFPRGKFVDQVDGSSGAFNKIAKLDRPKKRGGTWGRKHRAAHTHEEHLQRLKEKAEVKLRARAIRRRYGRRR